MNQSRTHKCNELRIEDVDKTVTLAGWYENIRRVSKNLAFLILRDFSGIVQIVLETEELLEKIDHVNRESTISVTGIVRERSSKNRNIPTGEIEIDPIDIMVLGKCIYKELPFEINRSKEAEEKIRLKYRYLDLRNPAVKSNMILRSKVVTELRKSMADHDFFEITTPILTASSPEGARDYLVPSRNYPGKFYALPQAPQQFKQLLMAAGFDRYFQIAPCFRDEDARADRSPGEFYQLDMEMAFATQEDVFQVIEQVLPDIFYKFGSYKNVSPAPFTRITYKDAMERFGSDKPDLRIDLTLQDMQGGKEAFAGTPLEKNFIKAVVLREFHESRKFIDQICDEVYVQTGNKMCWFKVDENGSFTGGISKFLTDMKTRISLELNLKSGDFIGISAGDRKSDAQKTAGVMRNLLGRGIEGHFDKDKYEFCWIIDFPMYEKGAGSGSIEFCHNPFSMPQGGMEALNAKDPLEISAYQYDLVCNGVELSSGAVRNHDPELMVRAFEIAGMSEEDVKAKFPAMYEAFCYGAPPHAGIAPGVDRMVMLLCQEDSIREVIPFPMNKNAQDIMMGAPAFVEQKQLQEVHMQVVDGNK